MRQQPASKSRVQEAGSREQEAGSRKQEAGSRKQGAGLTCAGRPRPKARCRVQGMQACMQAGIETAFAHRPFPEPFPWWRVRQDSSRPLLRPLLTALTREPQRQPTPWRLGQKAIILSATVRRGYLTRWQCPLTGTPVPCPSMCSLDVTRYNGN